MDTKILILGSDANAYYMARCAYEYTHKKISQPNTTRGYLNTNYLKFVIKSSAQASKRKSYIYMLKASKECRQTTICLKQTFI